MQNVLQIESTWEKARLWRDELTNAERSGEHGDFIQTLVDYIWDRTGEGE